MLPSDPSFLVATGVFLDLIDSYLESLNTKEGAPGFWVEWLAWGILLAVYWTIPFLRRFVTSSGSDAKLEDAVIEEKHPQQGNNPWMAGTLSVCLVGSSFLSESEHGTRDWLLPVITTAVLLFVLASHALHSDQAYPCHIPFLSSGSPLWARLFPAVASSILSFISAKILLLYSLKASSGIDSLDVCLSLLQCSGYSALAWVNVGTFKQSESPSILQGHLLQRVSVQSFGLWTILLAVSRGQHLNLDATFLTMGTLRAFHHFLLFTLCLRYSPSTVVSASTLPTIAMAIMQSLRAEFFNANLASALVAVAALFQNVCCLPASASRRKFLFLILLLPGVVLVPRHPSVMSWSSRLSQTLATPDMHPIEKLAASGQEQFSHLLTRQSNTFGKAVAEYVRRYRRNPPRNFDKWFKIAEREDYVLFDEFDTIMETLEPFWSLSAAELRSRVNAALEDPRIIRFNITNAIVMFDHEGWAPWMAEQVQSWLPPEWRLLLPDMTFPVNILDEPRVLAPFDILSRSLHHLSATDDSEEAAHLREWSNRQHAQVDFLRVSRQSAWQEMASACSLDSPARNNNPLQGEDRGLEFVVNATNSLDVCMQPSLHKRHGFFSSPDSLDITHTLVPIFSQGKPSIFNDVLFPSPYYAGRMDKEEYVEEEDTDWTLKSDTLYWSGATTGGYATMINWETLHRQRLILALKPQPSNLVTVLNETSPGQWNPHTVPTSDLQSLFNVKIVGTAQCDPEACEAERFAFNILPFDNGEENPNKDPLNLTYQAKYALDMDGNGFSGRYYRLLKSRSAVVKQTIFKEWHDGHLVPWVHYIPLSMDGTELPEIMRFLIQDRRGRRLGERVARESRSWANITLRKIDLQLAFLRLLLEYGRLMSDQRDTLYYEV